MSFGKNHAILLLQADADVATRTYRLYGTVKMMIMDLCSVFEEHLKRLAPGAKSISYDMSQLFAFLDNFEELSCLVFNDDSKDYKPCSREWIKQSWYVILRSQCSNVPGPSTQTTLGQSQSQPQNPS